MNQIKGIRYDPESKSYEYNGNGLIKDYHCYGCLLFEGEYLNGWRNGKGKEFDGNGNIIFEGDYLCNKLWNGKNNDENKTIIYEIKYEKGFLKQYREEDGKLELFFSGEFFNGELNGKVKNLYIYDLINSPLEDEFKNNKKQGKENNFSVQIKIH